MAQIGIIQWTSLDVASGALETGERNLDLEDVSVVPQHITRRERELTKRMSARMASKTQTMQDTLAIMKELETLEDPDDVVKVLHIKTVALSPTYSLTYGENAEPVIGGFGLTAQRTGEQTFGWDWFTATGPELATKLQEQGTMTFKSRDTPCGTEIVYMRFETDVSLRISKPKNSVPGRADWRVNVLAGSEIYWPSLFDGKLLPNGFVDR